MVGDIGAWLDDLELSKYAEAFVANDIELRALPHLTDDDLKDIGVSLGHRRVILAAASKLVDELATEVVAPKLGPSTQAERRQLTVMFCDLVGSTALSRQLDPEDLRDVMRRYQDAVAGAVTRYGGHVAKYLGDGVLAYFGWPQAYEDQAERAVRAGLDAVRIVNDVQIDGGRSLEARVGIATGQVVVGDLIGESGRDAEAVTGETPNLAARLQGAAEPGQVVIGDTTRQLIGQTFALNDLGEQDLKGFDDRLRAWSVAGEQAAETRFEAAHQGILTRLVGRDGELQLLLDRWGLAKSGEGQVALISGEPGIGKSRLSQALRDALDHEGHVRIRYQCSPHHINSALYPTIQQLQHAAGFEADEDIEAKLGKLEALLRQSSDDIDKAAPLFANLLSLPYEDRYGSLEQGPAQIKQETLQAIIDQMLHLAARQPLLFLLEDAHWIDPTSLELFQLTVSRINNAPILMVITHRPEWQSPFGGQDHVTSLQLNRLGRAQGTEIVRAIAGEYVPDDVVERIVQRTDGVPLFVEELTKTLVEGGLDIADADIPATLQASLLARLDRLGNETKEIAQIGAVIGRDFRHDLLTSVAGNADADVEVLLNNLVKSELVSRTGIPPDAYYTFKHALVQDAAYASMLQAARRLVHGKVAKAIMTVTATIADTQPELLAHHYARSQQIEDAISWWQRAGDVAARRSQYHEAIAHYRAAIDLTRDLDSEDDARQLELTLQLKVGPLLTMTEGVGSVAVEQTFLRADELNANGSDIAITYPIKWHLWYTYEQRTELDKSGALAEEMLQLAAKSNDTGILIEANHAAWTSGAPPGRMEYCLERCKEGIGLFEEEQHGELMYDIGGHDPLICGLLHGRMALSFLGFAEQALEYARNGQLRFDQLDHVPSRMLGTVGNLMFAAMTCEHDEVERYSDEAILFSERVGAKMYLGISMALNAWCRIKNGASGATLEDIEDGIKVFTDTGARLRVPLYQSYLADAALRLGKVDYGLQTVEQAIQTAEATNQRSFLPLARTTKGRLLMTAGSNPKEAELAFRRAIDDAVSMKLRKMELQAANELVRLLLDQNRHEEALALLHPLYNWFTEGFDTPDLIEAKVLLDELS